MKTTKPSTTFRYSLILALAIVASTAPRLLADDGWAAGLTGQHHSVSSGDTTGALVDVVRQATERFKDVSVAEAEDYHLLFGCVSGPDSGAMGMHYVNLSLVGDGELDPTRPEIVIYEPMPDGRLKLIGADFLVFADAWNAKHQAPPEVMGQLLHLFEAPNRFGLPAFYTLHVWAWKDNPTGTFVNWHSNVRCDAYSPKVP
jgi:hypothetical protein